MKLIHTDFRNEDFLNLTTELDMFLDEAIGGKDKRKKFVPFNQPETLDAVVLLYDNNGICAGCGAYRRYDEQTAEIKRIFVRSEFRGHHYSELILEELTVLAMKNDYQRLILETGEFLASSVQIYQNMGFYIIPNYPPYEKMNESLCMERRLDKEFRIRYKRMKELKTDDLVALYQSVNWTSANYPEKLTQAISHSQTVYSAWDGDRLIGLVNAIDDTAMTAYLHWLLVHPDYQAYGIGRTLLSHMKYHYRNYLFVLLLAEHKDVVPFYQKCGFSINPVTPMRVIT